MAIFVLSLLAVMIGTGVLAMGSLAVKFWRERHNPQRPYRLR